MAVQVKPLSVVAILDRLEAFHGPQQPCWPIDAYQFLIWWHCGYPASDTTCKKGWDALKREVGIEPSRILTASQARLAHALKAGGMVPELRAMRLQKIAQRVMNEFSGDLSVGLKGSVGEIRKALKKFPGIADPGADRILLFSHLQPVAAVPSNCPQVLVRIQLGLERENYGVNYREARKMIEDEIPEQFHARQRAYLLQKQHGQTICKRSAPLCDQCPISANCAYFAGKNRGRSRPGREVAKR